MILCAKIDGISNFAILSLQKGENKQLEAKMTYPNPSKRPPETEGLEERGYGGFQAAHLTIREKGGTKSRKLSISSGFFTSPDPPEYVRRTRKR